MSFQECELAILRSAVDSIDKLKGKTLLKNDQVQKIINIVEDFISNNKLVCYGGTAINNILPKADQFYNKDIEIPDYDFFSPDPLNDAIYLADMYHKEGFEEVDVLHARGVWGGPLRRRGGRADSAAAVHQTTAAGISHPHQEQLQVRGQSGDR